MKPNDVNLDHLGHPICPECGGRVTTPYRQGGKIVRRHRFRKHDGEKCPYGWTEGDLLPRARLAI